MSGDFDSAYLEYRRLPDPPGALDWVDDEEFPPYMLLLGMFKDEGEVSFAPGEINKRLAAKHAKAAIRSCSWKGHAYEGGHYWGRRRVFKVYWRCMRCGYKYD